MLNVLANSAVKGRKVMKVSIYHQNIDIAADWIRGYWRSQTGQSSMWNIVVNLFVWCLLATNLYTAFLLIKVFVCT